MSYPMSQLPLFSLASCNAHHLEFSSAEGHRAHLLVLEEEIFRLLVLPCGQMPRAKTWAIAPGAEDVPYEGRDLFDVSGFALPHYQFSENADEIIVSTERLRLILTKKGFFCRFLQNLAGKWVEMAKDRPTQAYNFGWWDEKVYHYLVRDAKDELYFGLGERSGDMNRHGQAYRLCNLDPMGYSARTSDPLYKHIPFYMTWKKESASAFGLFYDTYSDCNFNFGKELDNYHGHYRSFVADDGDLDFYVIAGPKPADVSRRFTWLTGRPLFAPKWSLGYSGSTMTYTDEPNAQERMNEFLDKCTEHDIACDSFHLSSGYTSINGKRYVFNWNRDKFPDPKAFAQHYLDHGVHLCANIKPCLLKDHPRFAEAQAAGLFICEPDGKPAEVQFWDETGAYLDFTNPKTFAWWKARVKDSLLEMGISATWNDNNEFEIWSKTPQIHGFGKKERAKATRPLQTLLMIKASKEAQAEFAPSRRPFLITRAGVTGMQRYAQTWSGDNFTSWESLKYNLKMGLGLALSGVSNTGHDIGGFSGPAPDPELLVRWVAHGIFLPRFSIHSWNEDKTVNEPWMYPEVTDTIRKLIQLRARFTPYFYDLLYRSHAFYEPIMRPTFHDFPEDAQTFAENDDFLLGESLLVASVVEAGAKERAVYLPKGANWFDYWSGKFFAGGQTITLDAPWDVPPLLVKENSLLPQNLAPAHFAQKDDRRAFECFIGQKARFEKTFFEDDGQSHSLRTQDFFLWHIQVSADAQNIVLFPSFRGASEKAISMITFLFQAEETRVIKIEGATLVSDERRANRREMTVRFSSASKGV